MGVEFPETMEVHCDDCGESEDMPVTPFTGDPATCGISHETLEEHGWTYEGTDTYCQKCSKERALEEITD
jgi:hypothetical protein